MEPTIRGVKIDVDSVVNANTVNRNTFESKCPIIFVFNQIVRIGHCVSPESYLLICLVREVFPTTSLRLSIHHIIDYSETRRKLLGTYRNYLSDQYPTVRL